MVTSTIAGVSDEVNASVGAWVSVGTVVSVGACDSVGLGVSMGNSVTDGTAVAVAVGSAEAGRRGPCTVGEVDRYDPEAQPDPMPATSSGYQLTEPALTGAPVTVAAVPLAATPSDE